MAEEAYNAGFAAFESGASRDSVPEKYKDFAIEWQNGWDNAKDIKDHNVGAVTDGPVEGEEVETPSLPEQQPSTPEQSQPSTPTYSWE